MTDKTIEPDELAQQVPDKAGAETSLPPVHDWNPDFSGDMDMRIARDGEWYYRGNVLHRKPLVRLFSTILRRDPDDHYYLVTPVEKYRIQVDDVPFVAHSLEREGEGRAQTLWLTTNVGDRLPIDGEHPLTVETRNGGEPAPYVRVRHNLDALIERQTFYELVDLAVPGDGGHAGEQGVFSAGAFYVLGKAQ